MSVVDTLMRAISGPASQIIEPSVRDIVDEVLRQQQAARPEDVDALRGELEQLKSDLHALSARISSLVERLSALSEQNEKLQAEVGEAMEAARKAQEAPAPTKPEAAPAEAAPAEAAPSMAPAAAKASPAPKASKGRKKAPDAPKGKPGRKSLAHLGCQVPGCDNPHRSRGFCGKHYQAWRRGSLKQFIMPDGTLEWKGQALRVPRKHGGQTFKVEMEGDKPVVFVGAERKRVEAETVAPAS